MYSPGDPVQGKWVEFIAHYMQSPPFMDLNTYQCNAGGLPCSRVQTAGHLLGLGRAAL